MRSPAPPRWPTDNAGNLTTDETGCTFTYEAWNRPVQVNGTTRNAFGATTAAAAYVPFLDFDGAINGTDLAQFRSRFGVILP